ncbi:MAG: HK97 gp10 family phage protein [Campylobacter sp.]|nr:HK97 gp10 family phage protein [Campylobacter sp.]
MRKITKNFINRMANEIMVIAKEKAPVDTANLQGDIRVLKNATESSLAAVIGNTKEASYAKFVHFGTKPFTIKPKKKKALKTKFGVFKKVNHPGSKANPYFEKAVNSYTRSGEFKRAKNELLKGIKTSFINDLRKEF